MSFEWQDVVVIAIVVFGAAAIVSAVISSRAQVASEAKKAQPGEQYQSLAADYGTLAKETRDALKGMQADLADLRKRVEAVERMMREVG